MKIFLISTLLCPAILLAAEKDPSLKEAKIPCVQSSQTEGTGLGHPPCSALKPTLKNRLKERMANVIAHFYDGKLLGFSEDPKLGNFCVEKSDLKKPVCALADMADSSDKNWKNEDCGSAAVDGVDGMCNYQSPGDIKLASCGKENAWFLGAKVQSWQHFTEQVSREVDEGTLVLVDYGTPESPAHPCGAYADAIERVQNNPGALLASEEYVKNRSPGAANGDTCAKESTDAASIAACHLKMARKHLESLYHNLLACEVMHRSKKSYYYNQTTLSPYKLLFSEVVKPCVDHAQGQFASAPDETTYYANFYKCYKGQVEGKLGAKKHFENWMKTQYPSDEKISPKKFGEVTEVCSWSST